MQLEESDLKDQQSDFIVRIGVASKNPVKINAVTNAAQSFWENVQVIGITVENIISNMPLSKSETRFGALHRAKMAVAHAKIDLGIGLEGGICFVNGEGYLFSAVCVSNGEKSTWGGECLLKLPANIVDTVQDTNKELGNVIDDVVGTSNIKQKEGAIGIFTNGVLNRTMVFEMNTKLALAPWHVSS